TLSTLLAQALTQFVEVPTCTGTALLLLTPMPSAPDQLLPHAHKLPSFLNARPCKPAAICFQSLPGTERTGVGRVTRVPSPNCQLRFSPQPQIVPSDFSASVCAPSAATSTQLLF